ncbi:MAG: iron-sulfur cluster carrier protein [Chitinophagales bacterium]|nr:MAG: iron-sulfur cluster carrier protein [Chitinophagales bacterium]
MAHSRKDYLNFTEIAIQMQISEKEILMALSRVIDPDLKKDIVSLSMVEDVKVTDRQVSFTLVLTTPACPLKDQLRQECVQAIHRYVTEDLSVDITFTSRITSGRKKMTEILPNVKNIICVASGKGGVGKSTVAVNLAIALADNGSRVGLIDADIYGPSVPVMLGLKGQRPTVQQIQGKPQIIPIEKYGIKVISIGFLVDERQAIVWRGPMVSSALKQFFTDCHWEELDYLILDLPPGTGDIQLTLAQTLPVTGAIVVTTPQEVALADVRKAIGMFRMDPISIPIIGIVENMAYFTPADAPDKRYYIFGQGGGQKIAAEYELPLLGQIPVVEAICQSGDEGVPVFLKEDPRMIQAFRQLAANTERYVAVSNFQRQQTGEMSPAAT